MTIYLLDSIIICFLDFVGKIVVVAGKSNHVEWSSIVAPMENVVFFMLAISRLRYLPGLNCHY
ncbi:hypothetical protein LINGRAHAP2_LOCUS10222 [Linum grandiflorum]